MTDAFSDLVLPVFRSMIDLLGALASGSNPALEEVKTQTRAWLDAAELKASNDPRLAVEFDMVRYALVGWIDEMLTDSAWGESVEWGQEDHVLEWDVFQDHNRATKFYEHAEIAFEALTQARASSDPLETYLLCATLGFRGELGKYDEARFNVWVDRVYNKVGESNPMSARAFSEPDDVPRPLAKRGGPALLLTVSVLSAITVVTTLFAYLTAVHLEWEWLN